MNGECIALRKTDIAERVAKGLGTSLHEAQFRQFSDGELNVTLENPAQYAGKTAIIIQSTADPVNEMVLGVSFLAQGLKNAGAQRVIAVIPYFGYSRQECSPIKGKPGHVAVVAQLLQAAGIDELISVELHDEKIIDLFTIPVHNLSVAPIIAERINAQLADQPDVCLVAPDKGAAEYVKDIANQIGRGTLVFSKERFAVDQTRITGLAGSCQGSVGVIIDDIIATGGTALNVCAALPERGFSSVYGYFVHPVLAGAAVERITSSAFNTVFVGNTIPLKPAALACEKIKTFDVSSVIVAQLEKML